MRRLLLAAIVLAAAPPLAAQPPVPPAPPFVGVWSLDRSLSEFPAEIGFDVDQVVPPDADDAAPDRRGGRGRRAVTPAPQRRESFEDTQRVRLLTDEVRNPPVRLTIIDNAAAVIITTELGQTRTLHPNAQRESIDIQGVPVGVTTRRDGPRLVVTYHVEQDRDVRFTYAAGGSPAKLAVAAEFLERGKGSKVTRVYDAGESVAAAAPAPETPSEAPRESFDDRPGAEFKGLTRVGLVVEDLGPDALACGLKRDVLADTLDKRLTAGGLTVRKNADEDTYVYVNVITQHLSDGTCVSRYDAFLYTHATAKLSYRDRPVLAQVSLIHRGNIGSSGVEPHAGAVAHALEGYMDLFLSQIHDANK